MAKKKSQWVVHGTHPTTYDTHILRREGQAGPDTMQTLEHLGYIGVMITAADYYESPKFEDPWAKMRAKGKVRLQCNCDVTLPDTILLGKHDFGCAIYE